MEATTLLAEDAIKLFLTIFTILGLTFGLPVPKL
jgi:hypothetical protein